MQETGDLGGSLRSALARREPRRKQGELQLLAVEHGINIECAFDLLVRKWLILSKVCQPFTPPQRHIDPSEGLSQNAIDQRKK
jgi:hypothetical protein